MERYPKSVFILTSRPGGYDYYEGKDSFKSMVFVQPFEQSQWKAFINKWYFCYERARHVQSEENIITVKAIAAERADQLIAQVETSERTDLAAMATNPLMLNMIAILHRNEPDGQLPKYRAELYESICQLQLGARPKAKKVRLLLKAQDSQRILQQLALKLQGETATQISETALLSFLHEALNNLDKAVVTKTYLQWLCQVSELLVERNTNEYEFSHRSFQSYLAALEIGQRNQRRVVT